MATRLLEHNRSPIDYTISNGPNDSKPNASVP